MKFSELLLDAIRNAEIPLRFEPGAEAAIAEPVTELLRAWVAVHDPDPAASEFEYGQKALIVRLIEELDNEREIPVDDPDSG